MCKINPKIDFAFKKLFGSEQNKDLLISLINSIITKEDKIKNVILKNPYNFADYKKGKMSILDIKAEDEKGHWINIEMQIAEDLNFDKRAIYYWAKMITDQLSEGMMFKELNKTISISILDFNIIKENPKFHTRFKILNDETDVDYDLHDMFELHYIELKKFRKEFNEIANPLDRWVTFLTKSSKLNKKKLPSELSSDPQIVKAVEQVDRMFNEDEREMYNIRLQQQMDFESKLDSAYEKGKVEERIIQERKREDDKLKLVNKMLKKNMSIDDIIEMVGLTKEEIEKLR